MTYYTTDKIHIVMDLKKYGSLKTYLDEDNWLSDDDIRIILEQILEALDKVHMIGVLHRDIKLENILIKDLKPLNICIADFGLACNLSDV